MNVERDPAGNAGSLFFMKALNMKKTCFSICIPSFSLYNKQVLHIVYAFGLARVFLPCCLNSGTTIVFLGGFCEPVFCRQAEDFIFFKTVM